jgi:putative membrane protein
MSPPPAPRRPRAFGLAEPGVNMPREPAQFETDELGDTMEPVAPRPRPPAGPRWAALFVAAVAALASLALGVAVAEFIAALMARQGWLGWLALALASLAGLAFLGLMLREIAGIVRLSRLRRIHESAAAPLLSDRQARAVLDALAHLYAGRPELAPGRAEIRRHHDEVVDAGDRLAIAERALMPVLDAEARRLIGDAAKRVSLVTAISPAAAIDVGVVLYTQFNLIRRIATLYGARPGAIGLVRLARLVVTHLALTGSIALGDDMIQQLVGHGLAARLSARLGEGVLNGLMTARVGLAALDLCRPLPFRALSRPRVTDFARLFRASDDAASRAPDGMDRPTGASG